MQLEKAKYKMRCEFGACKEFAGFTVKLSRVGIKSRIHVCENCLIELGTLIEELTLGVSSKKEKEQPKVPKSIETLKPKKGIKMDDTTIKEG